MHGELRLRVVSALVLATIAVVAAWSGGFVFRLFSAALAVLIHIEWTAIVDARGVSPYAFAAGWVSLLLIVVFTLAGAGVFAVATILAGAVLVTALALAVPAKPVAASRAGWLGLGIVYAGFSGLALAEIRDDTTLGLLAIGFVFAVVWATDIFAYFCGRAFGGPKLAPRISPSKTWSGAIFGMAAGVVAGTALTFAVLERSGYWVPFLAAVLSISSQIGDLFESWMKRRYAVKDSGRLIPGHGGVMDRVDGLVFAAFSAFVVAVIASGGIPTAERGSPIAASLFGL